MHRTALVVAALLIASSCGTDTEPSGSERAGGEAAGGDFEAVTIEHTYGTTEISERPERVAVVGLNEQDALLALGVVPVATTEWFGEHEGGVFPWAQESLGDAEPPVVLETEQEFEQVASLKPDLIVAMYSSISEADYDLYAAIAPTIAQPADSVDYGVSWQTTTLTLGEALGESERARALVDDVEQRVSDEAEAHPEFAGAAAMATIYEGIFVYGPEDPRGRLLTDLGFTFPSQLADVGADEFGASISPEQADRVDLDTLVWINGEDLVDDAVPTYQNLNVATEGRDVFVAEDDPLYEATSFVTVLSVPYLLDGLVPQLAAAADGDPSTGTG